eukprot:CAMPEP_0181370202 /NCGR_PEP_ID=MMETSP1106-20121128/13277_1 /TAXON_ID=81844 /ORGANISM="Mantoniella antarctica, Strain SL-175" /LENGTH=188 /DNA_ID=CAMNT_0023486933 /DNA_START=215 /DNA_END=781 /DNA_ORIENTATION=+
MTQGNRRKVHTTFEDGAEMVEEYDLKTDELVVRKRRSKTVLGKDCEWEFLVGETPRVFSADTGTLIESGANPVWTRSQDTPQHFVWRARNLPYPKDTYSVSVDHGTQRVVVRTSNKKFYKPFEVPELRALGQVLDEAALTWDWKNNTLVVQYRKPVEAVRAEVEEKMERRRLKDDTPVEGGDADCKQQ